MSSLLLTPSMPLRIDADGVVRVGRTRVTLDTGVPIANGILTTEDDDQALARMQVKGADCAQAAVEMARLLKALA